MESAQRDGVPAAGLTDESYWNSVWDFSAAHSDTLPPAIIPSPTTRWLDEQFARALAPGKRFVEIGAGGSAWLGHVADKYGAEAWGIDFSRQGLQLCTRAVSSRPALVHLVDGDVFDRDKLPMGAFDVVYSGGFVEHFPEPAQLMRRLAELLAPGGICVTAVPNLCGLNGRVQKWVDRDTYDKHVVISTQRLDATHALGGMTPLVPAQYLGVIDVGAVNYLKLAEALPSLVSRGLQFSLAKVRRAGELYDRVTHKSGGRWLAPMVGGVYRRDAHAR